MTKPDRYIELSSADHNRICSALDRIGEEKPSNSIDLLVRFIDHSDPVIRRSVARNLSNLSDPRVVKHLAKMILSDTDMDACSTAITALDEFCNDEAYQCLLMAATHLKDWRVYRQEIARQLRKYDTDRAVDILVKLLTDEDLYVQEYAIEGLMMLDRTRLEGVWRVVNPFLIRIAKSGLRLAGKRAKLRTHYDLDSLAASGITSNSLATSTLANSGSGDFEQMCSELAGLTSEIDVRRARRREIAYALRRHDENTCLFVLCRGSDIPVVF